MQLRPTLLPVPVAPAMSRWGIWVRSVMAVSPLTALPSASVRGLRDFWKTSDWMISRSEIISRTSLGSSMATEPRPLMRSMRIDSASSASARSSARPTIFEYLMPASGLNSYVVTTGPGWISTTVPVTPNSRALFCRVLAFSNKCAVSGRASPLISSRMLVGGSAKPLRVAAVGAGLGAASAETAASASGRSRLRAASARGSGSIEGGEAGEAGCDLRSRTAGEASFSACFLMTSCRSLSLRRVSR